MKTAQHKWSQSDGWRPNLPTGEVGRQSVVFVFDPECPNLIVVVS